MSVESNVGSCPFQCVWAAALICVVLMVQVRLLAALWRQVAPKDKEACEATASADRDR